MTRADVNTDINNKITSKTAPESLSNAEDGANRVLMMDYVDQEIEATQTAIASATITKVLKTTITQSQILSLGSSPIIVLPNTSGIIKIPITCMIIRNGGGTNYTMASNLYINTIGTSAFLQIPNDVFTGTARISIGFSYNSTNPYIQEFFPLDYTITANVEDPTGGTGDVDVYVTYIEITL